MPTISRPAAVAGMFYPDEPAALARSVATYLAQAAAAIDTSPLPKMLLVPHAGYIYSGAVAARAYALLASARERIRRVVLLGPVHRVAVRGLAAPRADAFETPLGRVAVDRAALARLSDLPQVAMSDAAHAQEHSLEVQLPFLQTVLAPGFTLVPLVVGQASENDVAEVLERLWGGQETLILISSDLSHYQPYADAQAADRDTIDKILRLDAAIGPHQACGAIPLRGALRLARSHGLSARLLDLRNSGDTAGDRRRVVGYGAVAFEPCVPPGPDPLQGTDAAGDDALGRALLARARNAIARVLGQSRIIEPDHPALTEPAATFVTLRHCGALRGCIGSLAVTRRLGAAVRHHALAAAFRDTRFERLSANEWPGLAIEVSLLGPLQPLAATADEAQALAQLQPPHDGVILEWRGRRATFLPQVWERLREPREFMAALKHKAGLAADFWAADVALQRYRVRKFVAPSIGDEG